MTALSATLLGSSAYMRATGSLVAMLRSGMMRPSLNYPPLDDTNRDNQTVAQAS